MEGVRDPEQARAHRRRCAGGGNAQRGVYGICRIAPGAVQIVLGHNQGDNALSRTGSMPNKRAGLLPSSSASNLFPATISQCIDQPVHLFSRIDDVLPGQMQRDFDLLPSPPFSTAAGQRRDGLIRISVGIVGQRHHLAIFGRQARCRGLTPGPTDEDGLSPVERRKQKNLVAAATMTLPSNCSEDKGSASAASDRIPRRLIPLGGPSIRKQRIQSLMFRAKRALI